MGLLTRQVKILFGTLLLSFLSTPCAYANKAKVFQRSVDVSNVEQLRAALQNANQNQIPTIINLADGHYQISGRNLAILTDHLVLRSASGIRENVLISGEGMDKGIGVLIDVSANHFSLIGLTLKNARWHLIQVRAEKDADFFHLENAVLQDAGQQLLKVSGGKTIHHANSGVIKNSLFEYTAGIGPGWYIGGIDAHRSVDWLVYNNTFKNIASPAEQVAEHAIHFWQDSKNVRTLNNLIINSDRGIGYGMLDQANQNEGGVISHNVIIQTSTQHPFSDVGISLESSPNTIVSSNIIFSTNPYPNAIEYRFERTKGVLISKNISNKVIKGRNGASAELHENETGGISGQVLDNIQYLLNKP